MKEFHARRFIPYCNDCATMGPNQPCFRAYLPRIPAARIRDYPSHVYARTAPGLLGLACTIRPDGIPYETIVVLNEPSLEVEAELRVSVTGVEIISSPVNLGMAGAGNRGRSLARGEFLVTLHDDAEVEAGWLEALVETADAHAPLTSPGKRRGFPPTDCRCLAFLFLGLEASIHIQLTITAYQERTGICGLGI
jgi:glycosyltransferase involved in cell wall biosynthesis